MSNPKGNITSLTSYVSPWKNGKTKTIRVPIVLADRILEYARKLDIGETESLTHGTVNETGTDKMKASLKEVSKLLDGIAFSQPNSRVTKAMRLKLLEASKFLGTL